MDTIKEIENTPLEINKGNFLSWGAFLDWVDYATNEELEEAMNSGLLSSMQTQYLTDLASIDPRERVKFVFDRRLSKNKENDTTAGEYVIEL